MNRPLQALVSVGAAALLSGCASQSVKDAALGINNSHIAYGAVMKVSAGDSDKNIANCKKYALPSWAEFCAAPAKYVEVQIAYLHSSRLLSATVAAPIEWAIKEGAILQVDPKGSGVATRLAAKVPRDDCKWVGHDLESLTSRSGMAKGFAMGLLVVPAIVIAADDSLWEGGVVCDGWSYKALLQRQKS